ncbi:ABC transporter permease [Pseudonocardia eucalypti]|uniref:ABC transporter permease n=1 Tax=Pseudonocardia eucalypti TaxID=648755 RepID=A0ABP9PE57_9PSEU|nr:osmoprotectant transport system permease protein [Pseudonocardia eucalypti]
MTLRRVVTPLVLAAVLLVLWLYVRARPLDAIEARSLNAAYLASRTLTHLELTVITAAIILAIAIPLGIALTRPGARAVAGPVLVVVNIGQAIPSFGLLVLFGVWLVTVGVSTIAVTTFVIYGLLPVLRNTMVGLHQVDRAVVEAALGMGMTRRSTLFRVELPLAVPVILAGVRTALVITVGTVALATFIGAGGLGDVISNGIASNRTLVLVTGSLLVAVLALFVDWLAELAENYLRPRGL